MKTTNTSSRLALRVMVVILTGLLTTQLMVAQDWYNANWLYRSPVTVSNPGGTVLSDFQVKITLTGGTGGNFDFTKAKSDGSDILFTGSDGTTLIPFWIESWVPSTSAIIWVKVPSVPASPSTTSVYLYYSNFLATSIADGNSTFDFFDDFETPSTINGGYYTLSSPGTTILVQDQAWENSAPHTLDVVDWGSAIDGYRYWGYYGLQEYPQGDGVGLARSTDLATWTKYGSNPVINVDNARWPSVLLVGSTVHIFYTDYTEGNSTIVRETSSDGITFTTNKTLVVPSEAGIYNGSPDLFIGPTGTYYLYWVRITSSEHQIMARSASTIEDLSSAANITVMTSTTTLAAPDMMYRDGKYFLTCEVSPSVWETYGYESTSPVSGFTPIPGNPILGDGIACYSQHIFGSTLHAYYSKLTGSTWTMEHRFADVSQLPQIPIPDITKWTASGGAWNIKSTAQQNGITGNVIQGITSAFQILNATFTGTDYILEGYGSQVSGDEWGLGFRVENNLNYFTTNLYQINGDLYLYNWVGGGATVVTNVDAGTIDLNTWYKMTVKAHGNNFDAYINDIQRIVSVSSSSHPSGGVALFGEPGTNAYFNDIRVRKYAASEPSTSVGGKQNQLPALNISYEKIDMSCNGGSGGSINITVTDGTGPYTYLWSPYGQTSEDVSGLSAGTYSVQIEDATGRLGNQIVTITQPAAIVPGYSITSPFDCSTGTATVQITATGGTPGYTGTGSFQQSVGTKIYQVKDANNCTANISVTINSPASWLDPGWLYRKPVVVSNSEGTALSGFQVKITLTGGTGGNFDFAKSLSTNGSDIRITDSDGTTLIPFWIESWIPSTSAIIWVKVPSITANSSNTIIYLYYGNALATSIASGDNTFEFFDDFETPLLVPDNTKWTASGGTWTIIEATQQNGITGKVVQGITTGYQILSSNTFAGTDYILEAHGRQIAGPEWGLGFRAANLTNFFTMLLYWYADQVYFYDWINLGPTYVTNTAAGTIEFGTWYKMTVKAHGSYFDSYINDNPIITNALSSSHPSGGVALFGENGTNAYFNDLRVRRYVASEPSAIVGAEKSPSQWTGAVNSDWNNPGNWAAGVPDNCSNITISSELLPHITATTSAVCNDLIIMSAVTIDAGGALTVNHNLTNSGTLTINSSGTSNSGSLIVKGSNIGNVVYNRQLNTTNYHYFSSPVVSSTFPTTGIIWAYNEEAGTWDPTINCVSGKGYTLQTGIDVLNFTGSLVTTDIPIPATSPYADIIDGDELNYDGRHFAGESEAYPLGHSTTVRSLTNYGGGGWNLLGNPYTSAMEVDGFITENSAQFDPNYLALYLYDGSGYYYVTNNYAIGWPNGNAPDPEETHIQVGQGFFILAMNDNSTFTFTRSMQGHDTDVPLVKSAKAIDRWPGLQLTMNYGNNENSILLVYNEKMTVGLDPGCDVGQMSSDTDVEIYTVLAKDNGVNFTRQALPVASADTIVVPLGVDSEKGGMVTFSADVEPLENYKFWLEDRNTGIFTNLNTSTYTVTLPANTYGTGRFFIIASTNTPTGMQRPQAEDTGVRVWMSNDKVVIKGEVSDRAICEVYNLRGQKILETRLADGELNTVSLPTGLKGVYLVRVVDGMKVTTRKVALL